MAAREHQKVVDQDKSDLKDVNARLSRELAIKRSDERITHIFDLVSSLMKDGIASKTIKVEHNGQTMYVELSDFRKDKTKEESRDWADSANIIVRDLNGREIHDAIIQRAHNESALSVAYFDHTSKGSENNNVVIPRARSFINSETGKKQHTFNAEKALDNLPELREVEMLLQKAVEAQQSVAQEKSVAA